MEYHILANVDLLGAAVDKNVLVTGSIGSPGNGLSHHVSVLIRVTEIPNQLDLLSILWNLKLKQQIDSSCRILKWIYPYSVNSSSPKFSK